jgi:hypothetical protein
MEEQQQAVGPGFAKLDQPTLNKASAIALKS